jgi:hypothetical protein
LPSSSRSIQQDYEMELPCALAPAPAGFGSCQDTATMKDEHSLLDINPDAITNGGPAMQLVNGVTGDSASNSSSLDSSSGSGGSELSSSSSSSDSESAAEEELEQPTVKCSNTKSRTVSWVDSQVSDHHHQQQQQQQLEVQQRQQLEELAVAAAAANGTKESLGSYLAHPALGRPSQQQQHVSGSRLAGLTTSHPALKPFSSEQRSAPHPVQQPNKYKAHKSAGDLLKVAAAAAAGTPTVTALHLVEQEQHHRRVKRHSSSRSMPARLLPVSMATTPQGSSSSLSDGADSGLPDAASAAPHQYLRCMLQLFGCSRHFQQRQLFVTLVMSVLSGCPDMLSSEQQGQLLDRLEALATDAVPGVRYAVAAAMADVQQQAAQLLQTGTSSTPGQASQQSVGHAAAGTEGAFLPCDCLTASTEQEAAPQRLDSYHDYVRQLAECSRVVGGQQRQQCMGKGAADVPRGEQRRDDEGIAAAAADSGGGGTGTCEKAAITPLDASSPEALATDAIAAAAAATAAPGPELEWLVKLVKCQQFERLMVAVLTPGPL